MKIRIPNPFLRHVPVRYFRAEAIVKKRKRNFVYTDYVYFDAPTKDEAGKGLRNLVLKKNAKIHKCAAVMERISRFPIPMWSLAYWCPWLIPEYMRKKGFARGT